MSTFDEKAPLQRPALSDGGDDEGTVAIQRLLAWYFRERPPREATPARDLRDVA